MKIHTSILCDPDVNQGGGSSDSATDVKAATSSTAEASNDANEAPSKDVNPAAPLDANKLIADVLAKHKGTESSPEKKSEGSPDLSQIKTEEEKAEEKVESEATQEDGDKGEEKKTEEAVPYERFKEVNEKVTEYEAKVKELEPMAEAQKSIVNFCQENNISGEDFQKGMEFLRLMQVDPVAARKELEPIWNSLNQLVGETLPDDLKQAVNDGLLSEQYAKEIAKGRGNRQFSDLQNRNTQSRLQQDQQRQFVSAVQNSVKTWESTKTLSDPDFKPKSGPNAPDGKYEVFLDRFARLSNSSQIKTVADAVKLAEQAYTDVGKLFSSLRPKSAVSKQLSSTKSTTKTSTGEKATFVEGGATPASLINGVLNKYRK